MVGLPSLEPSDTQVGLYLGHFYEVKGSATLRCLPACRISRVTTLPLTEEGHATVWSCTAALRPLARLSVFLGQQQCLPHSTDAGFKQDESRGSSYHSLQEKLATCAITLIRPILRNKEKLQQRRQRCRSNTAGIIMVVLVIVFNHHELN